MINTNWTTILIVVLIGIIVVLKSTDSEKLKGFFFAFFTKSFIEKEVEEERTYFRFFNALLFLFSISVLSLVLLLFLANTNYNFTFDKGCYFKILLVVFLYFLFKSLIELAISKLFFIQKDVQFYLVSKAAYFYALCFWLFILFTITFFSKLSPFVLYFCTVFLFFVRFILQVFHNKKLIFSKLFYFILYICTLEIAPLLILFKLML